VSLKEGIRRHFNSSSAASRQEVPYGKAGLLNGRRAVLTNRPLCLLRTLLRVWERRGFHSILVDVYRLFELNIDSFYWLFCNLNAASASGTLARYHTAHQHVTADRNLLGAFANLSSSYLDSPYGAPQPRLDGFDIWVFFENMLRKLKFR